MKRFIIAASVLLATLPAGVAEAEHSTFCLDLTPETARYTDGEVHELTAFVAQLPPDHADEECSSYATPLEADVEVDINFEDHHRYEVDRTCVVPAGSNTCSVEVDGGYGDDRMRGWVDIDHNDETIDDDECEGLWEDDNPGRIAEPDATDEVVWNWQPEEGHVDTPCSLGSCNYARYCGDSATISIRRSEGGGGVFGRVRSESRQCFARRDLVIIRRSDGREVREVITTRRGRWSVKGLRADAYRARAYMTTDDEYEGCSRALSRWLSIEG